MPSSATPDGEIHYGYFDPTLRSLQYYEYSDSTFPPTYITKYAKATGKDFNYFFWNDDKTLKDSESDGASSSKAHAKGSLVYDADNGAFLLHSLPRFPTRNAKNNLLNELPSNGGSYGQTFFCITVDKDTAEQIAKLLNCINVSINKSVNYDRVNSSPNIFVNDLINNKMNTACDMQHTATIKSKGNEVFTLFGKNYKNKIIPYDTTLRQVYNDDFYARTWSRPSLSPSLNETYNLVNVLDVKFGIYSYGVNKEHSKWAISKNKNIVCFSDLNHTESQKERGGHIVCFENQKLHKIMLNAIVRTDEDGNA
jgi:deoxyribonuclease-2